jgi:glycosyltransferase involved in cell wall biosynthesis
MFNPCYASPNPRARTEAMLCGLAIVTTNSHGESEYIQNGVNGYASNNIRELYEYLEFLYHNPKEVRRIGKAGRETAQKVFHIDRFIAQWQEVLGKVISS